MMNVFLLVNGSRGPASYNLSSRRLVFLLMVFFAVLALALVAGYQIGFLNKPENDGLVANHWYSELLESQDEIERASRKTTDDIDALALRVGQLEARSIRLDALGSRLVSVAGMQSDEFDFTQPPALGGPVERSASDGDATLPDLLARFTQLQRQIDDRASQLQLLESILMDQELSKQVLPNGRPVEKGWMSSGYGRRLDPFTGRLAWHAGVDFSGKMGSSIVSVASGVVSYSDYQKGFGNVIEISHGNGYATRYAHNRKNLVKVGDTVEKNQVIATMGSSGRSTGPHVHFEVLKNGKAVNPRKYIPSSASK